MKNLTNWWNTRRGNKSSACAWTGLVLAGIVLILWLATPTANAEPQQATADDFREAAETAYSVTIEEVHIMVQDAYEPLYRAVPAYAEEACTPSCDDYWTKLKGQITNWFQREPKDGPIGGSKDDHLIFDSALEKRLLKPYDRFCAEYKAAIEERIDLVMYEWDNGTYNAFWEVCGNDDAWNYIDPIASHESEFETLRAVIDTGRTIGDIIMTVGNLDVVAQGIWSYCVSNMSKCWQETTSRMIQAPHRFTSKAVSFLKIVGRIVNPLQIASWALNAYDFVVRLSSQPDKYEFELELVEIINSDRTARQKVFIEGLRELKQKAGGP